MFIVRNALRSIFRSPGRTIIICIIVMVIATSACIALSIQQSAGVARKYTEESLQIRAHINVDRQYMMEAFQNTSEDSSTTSLQESMKSISGLTLDEMLTYAEADMVDDFYYYANIALNGDNGLTPMNENDNTELQSMFESTAGTSGPGGKNMPSMEEIMAAATTRGAFELYGYVSDASMEAFQDGDSSITSGVMLDPTSDAYECIITEELATMNSLKVGDQITLTNPGLTSERFLFTIVGLYKNKDDNTTTTAQSYDDPANYILTSYAVVEDIVNRSKSYHDPATTESIVTLTDGSLGEQLLLTDGTVVVKGGEQEVTEEETETDDAAAEDSETASEEESAEDSDEESDSATSEIMETVVGTYVFQSLEDYDAFEKKVYEMGLEEGKYTVTSNDVASFEASLVPLDNLSSYASSFLYIVLAVGAAILIGVNFYNIRERKYEIGALTAMGMNKWKVAVQFIVELTLVTFMGLVLGLGIGATVSVPVTNELLSTQISYEQTHSSQTASNFGRDVSTATTKPRGGDVEGDVNYVDDVQFSVDYVVITRMALIGAILTLLSSTSAVASILRYNPLTILAERN